MRRAVLFLAPPAVFALAALLAWRPGAETTRSEHVATERSRGSTRPAPADPATAVSELEREFLRDATPPPPPRGPAGMEALLIPNNDPFALPCIDLSAVVYGRKWARESPEGMFAWLTQRGPLPGGGTEILTQTLFPIWARQDLKSSIAAALTLRRLDMRGRALVCCVAVLNESDPGKARELLLENLERYAPGQPQVVFDENTSNSVTGELLLSLPPSVERTRWLASLLASGYLTKNGLPDLWAKIPENLKCEMVDGGFGDCSFQYEGLSEIIRERAEATSDPKLAEKYIAREGKKWAQRDLAGAFAWTQDHLKGRARVERGADLFQPAAEQDFDATVAFWRGLPEGQLRELAAMGISNGAPSDSKEEPKNLRDSLPP